MNKKIRIYGICYLSDRIPHFFKEFNKKKQKKRERNDGERGITGRRQILKNKVFMGGEAGKKANEDRKKSKKGIKKYAGFCYIVERNAGKCYNQNII